MNYKVKYLTTEGIIEVFVTSTRELTRGEILTKLKDCIAILEITYHPSTDSISAKTL